MNFVQIIGCVILYLVVGAVIAGIGEVDPTDDSFFGMILLWPLVLMFAVLIVISIFVGTIAKAIKGKLHG